MLQLLPFLISMSVNAGTPAVTDGDQWVADFDEAVKIARSEGKDLLVDFTGSDWCHWCIKLHEEVFAHDAFLDSTADSFVLVALDYPNSAPAKAKVPNPKRNDELLKKYGIRGYPTVLLMTPDGTVFGKTGYRPGGPEKYVEHLTGLSASGKKLLPEIAEVVTKYEAATGPTKEKLLDEATTKLEGLEDESPFAAQLVPIVRNALTLDPENRQGRKMKAVAALLAAGESDSPLLDAARALDPKNAGGLLERVVLAEVHQVNSEAAVATAAKAIDDLDALGAIKDKEIAKAIYSTAASWNMNVLKDAAKAKKYAGKLKAIVGDDPDYKDFLEKILTKQ